jgi:hypothetical protein
LTSGGWRRNEEQQPVTDGYDESVKSDDNERLDFGRGP